METITREQIQKQALEAFKKAPNNRGTICLSTGTGKSKVAIDFIKENPKIDTILITSPRTNLQENWKKELSKWGLHFNALRSDNRWRIDDPENFNQRYVRIWIENIQTAYKYKGRKFDLVIADEIHTMMTPGYSQLFVNNEITYLMGLTATHDMTRKNDKDYFYKMHCPVIYEYYDSADDGLINKTRFKIVNHTPSNTDRIVIRTKKLVFEQGELQHYEYLTKCLKAGQQKMLAQGSNDWFTDAADWFWKGMGTKEQKYAAMMYLNSIKARKEFLLNLPSTARLAKAIKNGILENIPGSKVLIFSELTAQADWITKHTVHSNNKPEQNEQLMCDFNEGRIRDLGSCRSLTLGLNLKGATHAIMESYIGSATQSKQKKGRLDRLASDDVAEMWIIRVGGTQGESWFNEMSKGFDLDDAEEIDSSKIFNNEYNFAKTVDLTIS